ncbi:MAG: J domain-containing protein [Kineosporiaceae bacterium]|nr:J domain-containing protein [Kineosporiaceae bacterium]
MATEDWLTKDLYAVLEVSPECNEDMLRRAYRRLAREHHPDINAGCPRAERRFKELGAAYAVLSNESRRERYDRMRKTVGPLRFHEGWSAGARRRARERGATWVDADTPGTSAHHAPDGMPDSPPPGSAPEEAGQRTPSGSGTAAAAWAPMMAPTMWAMAMAQMAGAVEATFWWMPKGTRR